MVCQILKHELKHTCLQHSVFSQNEKHAHIVLRLQKDVITTPEVVHMPAKLLNLLYNILFRS